ncbi:uncharacterized protein LOC143335304 [Chaetodon auriga]|uniref:uncharacterized protein LOC143335304 n=1 Tax=Chaetodon auriga TaxID=39042 RepID=UPI004032D46A
MTVTNGLLVCVQIYGRLNMIMGYADSTEFKAVLKSVESCWMNFSPSDTSDKVDIHQVKKINGTCFSTTMKTTVVGDSLSLTCNNITTVFHVLPSCEGCVVFSVTATATNFGEYLDALNLDSIDTREHFTTRVLYLMAREDTVKDSGLEDFKMLASCLGFSGEPDFHYDTKKGFCEEVEGVQMTLN